MQPEEVYCYLRMYVGYVCIYVNNEQYLRRGDLSSPCDKPSPTTCHAIAFTVYKHENIEIA